MSSVDSIYSIGSKSVDTFDIVENKKTADEQSILEQTDSEPNSSLERMQEEEKLSRAASPHLRKIIVRNKVNDLKKAIERVEGTAGRSKSFLVLVKFLVTFDLAEARSVVDQIEWEGDWVKAMVEISRHQELKEAQATLAEVKNFKSSSYPFHLISYFPEIFREEKIRGMPEAEETLKQYLKYISSKELKSGESCGWLAIFKVQAELDLPEASKSLKKAKEALLKERKEIGEGYFISRWRYIIEAEAQFPEYNSSMMKDVDFILKTIGHSKWGFGEFYCEIHDIFKAVLPVDSNKAKEILAKQSYDVFAFSDRVKLVAREIENREEAFEALIKQVVTLDPEEQPKAYVKLFKFAAAVFGLKVAMIYLDAAKDAASKLEDDPQDCSRAWARIAKAEMAYGLPSLEESLAHLSELTNKESDPDSGTVKAIVEIECEKLKKLI